MTFKFSEIEDLYLFEVIYLLLSQIHPYRSSVPLIVCLVPILYQDLLSRLLFFHSTNGSFLHFPSQRGQQTTLHKCWKQTMLVCRAPMREVWRKRERVGYLLGKQVLWTKGWNRGHWTCNFIKVAQSSSQGTSKWSPGHEEGRHRMGTFQWAS